MCVFSAAQTLQIGHRNIIRMLQSAMCLYDPLAPLWLHAAACQYQCFIEHVGYNQSWGWHVTKVTRYSNILPQWCHVMRYNGHYRPKLSIYWDFFLNYQLKFLEQHVSILSKSPEYHFLQSLSKNVDDARCLFVGVYALSVGSWLRSQIIMKKSASHD